MTLLGVKASTKDIDFMVPIPLEYAYLTNQLQALGYRQISGPGWQRASEVFRFDLFCGNRIHTTELLEAPLEKERNVKLLELSRIYVGILNDYDLISSKLMRGTKVDLEDCLSLAKAHADTIDIENLVKHFRELVSFDIAEVRLMPNIERFLELLREEGLYD